MTAEKFEAILAAQMPDAREARRAPTSWSTRPTGVEAAREQVAAILAALRARGEAGEVTAMAREIVLDTETTGLDPQQGHRLIEIACVELEDYVPTGQHFHCYIHPEREIDADAERVHGISLAFLDGQADASTTPRWCDALLEFVGDAPLVAHNAGFDREFVNHELARLGRAVLHEKRWVDTLAMAQSAFPGRAQFARRPVQAVQGLAGRAREARGADRRPAAGAGLSGASRRPRGAASTLPRRSSPASPRWSPSPPTASARAPSPPA